MKRPRKEILKRWILEVLHDKPGGSADIVEICREVWDRHEQDLRDAGSLFYTWQYDIRWAATALRQEGRLRPAEVSPRGVWELPCR